MKKLIYLGIGITLLVVLSIVAWKLTSTSGSSDTAVAAFNFDIKDTNSISKIIISESNGQVIEIIRNSENRWVDKDGGCLQQYPVNNILDAVYNARFKGYVPDNAIKTVVNRMATIGTKVEFFQNGEWSKTWYIGSSTPDHYGTYMLVESEEAGRSDLPVIAEIKGLKGIINPRFFTDMRRWSCTEIFSLGMNEINSVKIKYTTEPNLNFELVRKGANYSVTSNGKKFPQVDTSLIFKYLLNYQRVNFEFRNYDLNKRQVDSLKGSKPFCTLTVNSKSKGAELFKLYRKKPDGTTDEQGVSYTKDSYDIQRLWCVLPNGELVKCQYFVMTPLIMGSIYFNYPVSK